MARTIEVRFMGLRDNLELYAQNGIGNKIYARTPEQDSNRVIWSVAKETDSGYETGTPVKNGVIIRVVKGKKKEKVTLFEETMATDAANSVSAAKAVNFVSEDLQIAVKKYCNEMSLHNYNDWAKWLLKECAKNDYTGYQDNWLHFGTNPAETVIFDTWEILGEKFSVTITDWSHMVCDKVWKVVEIRNAENNVLELCGYAYDA